MVDVLVLALAGKARQAAPLQVVYIVFFMLFWRSVVTSLDYRVENLNNKNCRLS
jgi:hypothetical protein